MSAKRVRGGYGRAEGEVEGEGEWGFCSRGVLALEMAAARAWLPGGMGGTSLRERNGGVRGVKVSRKQSRVCLSVECRGGVVERL